MQYAIFPSLNSQIVSLSSITRVDKIIQELTIRVMTVKQSLEVRIPTRSKEGIYVYMCWIYMWCFTVGLQDDKEHVFRLNQLRQVIGKLKANLRFNLRTDLFYLLIEICYRHASYKMAHTIYETMCRYDVVPDNRIKLLHFDHRQEDIKAQRKIEKKDKRA